MAVLYDEKRLVGQAGQPLEWRLYKGHFNVIMARVVEGSKILEEV